MENVLFTFRRLVLPVVALALLASGSLPAVASAAPLGASPASLGFTQETVGKTSSSQPVTIANPVPGIVQLVGVSIGGADPGDFTIAGESCAGATLELSETCLVEVSFSPRAGGPRSATLEVAVEGEATIDVPLSGTGQTMKLTVPGSTSFATTSVGGTSTEKIALKNESEAGVNVSEVKFEGADASDFGIEGSNCVGFIGPNMACELTVRFSPTVGGPREALLRVTTDATPSEYVTELGGEGVAPELIFEPASYDFGLVEMHSNSPRTNLTLRNAGAASVQLSNLEITGPDTNEFWIPGSNCGGATLTPGAACSVEVQFNANNEGSFSAAVSVKVGSIGFQAPLEASAERPKVEASPTPFAFGPTSIGSRQVKKLTLTNTGNLPVAFYIALVSGGDIASFHLLEESCTSYVFSGSPRIFEPGESCVAKIAFEPTGVGAKAATLSFFGGGEGALQVSVEGTAVAPQLSLSPASWNFGAVAVGGSGPVEAFQLRNESSEAQAIDSAALTGPNLGEFQVRSDQCSETVLAPGESCAIAVRFNPAATGSKTATLRLRVAGGTIIARLGGEGTTAATSQAAGGRRGGVGLQLRSNPGAAGGAVTIGRARCESSEPCVVKFSGILLGQLSTAYGLRPGVRPLSVSRLNVPAGGSAPIKVSLPTEFRGSTAGARLTVSLQWRTGPERGGASRSFRLSGS